jgi:diaminopimelate decarboxylase
LHGLVNEFDYLKGITLCFEPGRSIIAQSGYFVAKVIEVAEKHGKCFIITDASISMFPRPHIYPEASHTITLVSQNYSREGNTITADVCGNSIYSRDILAKEVSLTRPEPGDLLVFHDAGAYCYSMRSHFLGGSFPRQFLAFNDKIVEI